MISILLFALLQPQDDLASFLAAIEKDRAQGTAAVELLKRIDAWAKNRPKEIQERLAWNRELLQAAIWADKLRQAWLTKRVGQSVTLGRTTGVVKEANADRVLLEIEGKPAEVLFCTLGFEEGLAEIRKEKLLEAPAVEEAILRMADGKTDAAFALARGFESVLDRSRIFRPLVGWALQAADRNLAEGKPVRAAEFLAAGWTKHEDLMEAADGALHRFVHEVLLVRLYKDVELLGDKDRKESRRILDLVLGLSKSGEVKAKVHAMRFLTIDSNQWHPLLLDEVRFGGNGEFKDGALGWSDPGADSMLSILRLRDLPIPWPKVSGVRVKVRPAAVYVDLRVGFGDPAKFYIVSVHPKDGKVIGGFLEKEGAKAESDAAKKVATKPEYLLRLESGKPYWKLSVDNIEAKLFKDPAADPSGIEFALNDGKCDIL
ncbi:MAG TPA: hypothetical protein VFS19_07340, partial [Planctomycetota bacterium]|nr:hypothetical protein [Planctomycetota bacterium]